MVIIPWKNNLIAKFYKLKGFLKMNSNNLKQQGKLEWNNKNTIIF
jgi:hypothetical protein